MRLNVYISSTGVCSRREADRWIEGGLVTINGSVAKLGQPVEEGDVVVANGSLVVPKKNDVYIALNKPVGITCTTEKDIDGNIVDFINYPERIFPIGRLDKESEGLILLTNDGDIVNKILRAENGHEKEYLVTLKQPITEDFIEDLSNGVEIYNPVTNSYVVTNKCVVEQIDMYTFKIVLTQGLNRQIRRMCSAFGYRVAKLKRVRIMSLDLGSLKTGEWRRLSETEVKALIDGTL
ncbi:MAG TPA: 23S rRNA pseudouridine synthase F [Firmicutes bacterium]|nr:23S rRNA pseudouridine synthase F [Bacillota bacterium]